MNKLSSKIVILIVMLNLIPLFSSIGIASAAGTHSTNKSEFENEVYSISVQENCNWSLANTSKDVYVYCSNEVAVVKDYQIANNRAKGTPAIKFAITIPRSSDIRSITPASFSLNPGEKKALTITVKIPDCKGSRDYIMTDFPFDVKTDPTACSRSVKITLTCRGECPCCSYQFEKGFHGVFPASLKPGGKATTTIRVSNACDSKPMTLKVSGNSHTTITPGPSVTLQAGKSQLFTITFIMPSRIGGSCLQDTVTAQYTIKVDGCNDFSKSFNIRCEGKADPKTNCNWQLSRKDPTNPPKLIYCSNETITTTHYQITSNMPNGTSPIQFKITIPKSSGIVYVTPASFTLKPGEKKGLTIKVKVPDAKGKTDPVKCDLPITVTTDPAACSKTVNVTLYSKDCTPCCEWNISGNTFPKQMCPYEEFKISPKIVNKCNKPVKYQISVKDYITVNGGNVAYVTVPANGTASFTLLFKMPKCKGEQRSGPIGSEVIIPAQKVSIQYSITPDFCSEKKFINIVECKSCP